MKRILIFLMIVCAGRYVPAAHFEHYDGMLWSQVGGWAEDADESDPYDDPGTSWHEQNVMSQFNPASVHSFASSTVSDANCAQDGVFSATPSGTTLTVSGTAWANGQVTTTDGILNSYAGFSPTEVAITNGIYFTLVGDTGENNGDLATIELTFTANGSVTGLGQASLNGGMGSPDVIVAVNLPVPSPSPINPEYIAYSYPGIQQVSSFNVNDTAVFKVKIGHTIAIFLGAGVSVDLGPGYIGSTDMTASATISLDIVDVSPYVAICEECDLDGSGSIDLGDLKILSAAWLSDAYPFPPPPPPPPQPGEACSSAYGLWIDWPEEGDISAGQSVWYEFTPETDNCYTIDLCSSNFDTAVELYDDCDNYIQGFDDNGCDPQSKLQIQLQAWQTYYLRIRGKTPTDQGYYQIVVHEGCAGGSNTGSDNCQDAPLINIGQTVTDDTTGATGTDETEYCGYDDDNRDLWYLFIAPQEGSYDVMINLDLDDLSGFEGTLALFAECGGEMYSCTETDEYGAYLNVYLMEDESILIRVASYEYAEDVYELSVYLPGE